MRASLSFIIALASLSSVLAIDNKDELCANGSKIGRSRKHQAGIDGCLDTCPSYTIINTRGTHEPQGPSAAFLPMNVNITARMSGGKIVDTVYPAIDDQNSRAGSQFIVRTIEDTLKKNPKECFILQGYSQGAAATTNALYNITGPAMDAIKAALLIGNPERRRGLKCNVDNYGGTTTRDVEGQYFGAAPGIVPPTTTKTAGVPDNWVDKVLDVCLYGDNVCDSTHTSKLHGPHAIYLTDPHTQIMGVGFIEAALMGKRYDPGTGLMLDFKHKPGQWHSD